ncbi:hypothetical protein F0U44_05965 [Nocardioides humilatus]|uniref:Probable pectate lyase C n=1 Tax=Nocardioides humilatus TaxID=2607660 RepID=A0A5B1LMP4_9ACTN|nr:Calx-beta domain-containing protein [Nocardioides humilatus]KAA1421813.1 hypothetical protein F0U44_05965 [Nocardioides humilatus]
MSLARSALAGSLATGLATIGLIALPAPAAHALAGHVYVAEGGTDSGACTSGSPCGTMTYAQMKVADGGTIHVSGRIVDNIDIWFGSLTITGAGAASPAILDGSGQVDPTLENRHTTVRLDNLRIEGGYGAIDNQYSDLTLTDVTIGPNPGPNQGAGIFNYEADVTLIRSTITGNSVSYLGGAIWSEGGNGEIRIIDSTFSDNHATVNGGAIDANWTPLYVVRSTFTGNSAHRGGAINADHVTVVDSTFSGNSGDYGGAFYFWGDHALSSIVGSTISGNHSELGATVHTDGATVTLAGNIIADNTSDNRYPSCKTIYSGTFVSAGYNLTDEDSAVCALTHGTDRTNTSPGLGPLQDNGGPTLTMLPSGAGAERVIPTGTTLHGVDVCDGPDQRGRLRPQPGFAACVSGATEPGSTSAEAPQFTSASSATVNSGTAMNLPVAATGLPTPALSATGLPNGVVFTDHGDGTGALTGSTTLSGTHSITLTATTGYLSEAVQTFDLQVLPPPTVSVNDVTVTEGHSGTKNATFTLTRTGSTTGTSSVKVATSDGTATAGADYTAVPLTTVGFSAGQTTRTVNVTITGDTVIEPNERLTLKLSAPVRATIGDATGAATLTNDDASVSVDDVTLAEGDSGTQNATFTLTRTGATVGAASVKVATANGTATAGSDYTALPLTTVSFAAGQTTRTVNVTITGDTVIEPDETLTLNLRSPTNTTIGDASGTATLTNDDSGSLAVGDITLAEGNTGTKNATFTVTRSGASGGTASVKAATANGTATAGSDYTALPLTTVSFAAGQTTRTVQVTITGDTVIEPNEILTLNLSAATGATISDATGTATLTNDDSAFSVDDVTALEGNSGTTTAVFTLTRVGSLDAAASVDVATANGSATAGTDYAVLATTTVAFAAGQATRTVSLPITGDTAVEADETFALNLTNPVGATVADPSGTGTISNDDFAYVAVDDVVVREGMTGTKTATFTLTRSGRTAGTSSVKVATAGATATAGSDFTALPLTTVSFAAGQTSRTVAVVIRGDDVVENDETLQLNLSAALGATIIDSSGKATIVNDDKAWVSVGDVEVTEGNSGTTNVTFTLTRSQSLSQPSSVDVETWDDTAIAGSDYVALPPTTITFAAGEATKSVVVAVKGDTANESNETFSLELTNEVGAVLGDTSGTATIVDNEGPPEAAPTTFFSIDDAAVEEGNAGGTPIVATITRTGDVSGASSVRVGSGNYSADQSDYNPVNTTVSFAAGERTKTVTATVLGDAAAEEDESFTLVLYGAANGVASDPLSVLTILTDDFTSVGVLDTALAEGETGVQAVTFTLTRSGSLAAASSVYVATNGGTATAGTDYVAKAATVITFNPGQATKTVTVNINSDTAVEPHETFRLYVSPHSGATVSDDFGVATILNDD